MVLSADPRTRRCLWVVPVSDLGGVARHTLDVAAHGIAGFKIVVLTPPGPLAERCSDAGIAVLSESFGPAFGTLRSAQTLRNAMRHLRPVIVHSHLAFADVVALLVASRVDAAVVSTEHGIARNDLVYHSSRSRSCGMAAVHTLRLRRTQGVVIVSDATRRAVQSKWHPSPRLRLRLIRNGIAPPLRTDSGEPGLRIGALARLAPEKGYADLLEAFALVRDIHPEATLRIGGVGSLERSIRAQIDRLGLTQSVSLCGFVDAPSFLESVDVLAQFSIWENCPYSILDAIAARTGVVATAVGGNPEILPDHCLTPLGDHAHAADRLIEQGLKPERRPALPPGWPDVSDMCDELASFYEEVLA